MIAEIASARPILPFMQCAVPRMNGDLEPRHGARMALQPGDDLTAARELLDEWARKCDAVGQAKPRSTGWRLGDTQLRTALRCNSLTTKSGYRSCRR